MPLLWSFNGCRASRAAGTNPTDVVQQHFAQVRGGDSPVGLISSPEALTMSVHAAPGPQPAATTATTAAYAAYAAAATPSPQLELVCFSESVLLLLFYRLSDKQKFPYFFRTVPMQEVDALIMLLRSFGWTRVTMFTTDTVWASDVSAEFERMWLGQHNSPDGEWTGQIAHKHTITFRGGTVDSASVQLALDTVPIDSPELNSRVIVLVCHTERTRRWHTHICKTL